MANRGDAAVRFKVLTDAVQERKHAWRIVEDVSQLYVIFDDPQPEAPPHQINLSHWLPIGKLAPVFAEAFARRYLASSRQTRFSYANSFRYGFVAYLCAIGMKLNEPGDAGPRLLFDFRDWIRTYPGAKALAADSLDSSSESSLPKRTKPWTQMGLWRPCMQIFQELIRTAPEGTWSVELPKKPFAGEKFLPSKPKAIDLNEYITFLTDVAQAVSETVDAISPHLGPISHSIEILKNGGTYQPKSIHHVVARSLVEYGGIIPERKSLERNDPQLFRHIERHGHSNVCRLAHPSFGDLIPFLYLIASHTGFNQAPLTHIELSQIQEPTILGVSRMTLSPLKSRANSIVRRSFVVSDEKLAVPSIIRFVEAWTTHIREAAPAFVGKDLWLFANKWRSGKAGNSPVRSLAVREKGNKSELANHLLRYCRSRGYKFTGMREIRLSFSELFLQANPGNLEGLRTLLGQKSVTTTANNYRTQQAIASSQEMLAGAMNMHQRWVGSGGKIDPRSTGGNRERTAATPGFVCGDLYDSPIPGQQKGRMCEGYGLCPGCPLAASDSDHPYAWARFHQLEEEYERAKARLGIEIWRRKYQQSSGVLSAHWIPSLHSPEVADAARQLQLSRLPELE